MTILVDQSYFEIILLVAWVLREVVYFHSDLLAVEKLRFQEVDVLKDSFPAIVTFFLIFVAGHLTRITEAKPAWAILNFVMAVAVPNATAAHDVDIEVGSTLPLEV